MTFLSSSQRRLSIAAVMIHMLGVGLTLGLTFPLTSLTLERWGSAGWVIGLAGAMAPLAILMFMPVLPTIAQRLGAVRAMSLGCLVGIAGLLIMYLFQTVPMWIVGRFVIGAGLALPWLAGDIWINSVVSEGSRGRVIAAYVACLFIGFAAGPLVLDQIGIDGLAPFAVGCAALILAVVPLIMVRRLAPEIVAERGVGIVSAIRAVPVVAVGAFLAGFTEALIFSLLTIWGLQEGMNEAGALRLLTTCIVGGIVLQFIAGMLADKVGRQWLIGRIGLSLLVAAGALQLTSGSLVFVSAFFVGGLILALYGLSLTLLGERFPSAQLAAASAAFLILYQLGSMAGPLVAGLAMDSFGSAGLTTSLAAAGLAMASAAGFWKPAK